MVTRSNVISNETSNQHVVEGYRFKVISEFSKPEEEEKPSEHKEDKETKEIKEEKEKEENFEEEKETPLAFQPSFVEDLLKKTDEMSNNIIKLQMQVESQESEFNNRLSSELENAKEKYTKEGYEKAKTEFEKEMVELKDRYVKSTAKLEEACKNLDNFIAQNEKELADTAVDIAKEVILKELDKNSAKIAYALAKDLLSELKGASAIELKVSAADYEYLKAQFEDNTHIKISLDDAITKGSVVILSDAGNIESNLNNRLVKVKKMINNE
ncbi:MULTISPECIES: flagellar assembly protein FliH [unclassified Campylobacter]|uniref:flagellar assembly protein FliH n=1 Tax=unclassified Campylobacter TaxID=2593542 RepID=UPI001237D93B|nr:MULTISPECIES: flagellar assembly protein FliH [unclassified Campylobacter]KAA6226032.1 flagellar assembly protein FliH [Campylobacter sp. LR196d]KAA6226625.1 flagellar assembly protein FliH [Campylobacter sp. LR286c]KAA6227555.1 flagellar assembly protein FliH [Campylobacter sp. LR185c]KAA8603318.1 flagellar assembly protein FliH [Campylobacter sp. LR185c]